MATRFQALTGPVSGVQSVFSYVQRHVQSKVQLKICHSNSGCKYDRYWCLHQSWFPADRYTLNLCATDALARWRCYRSLRRINIC